MKTLLFLMLLGGSACNWEDYNVSLLIARGQDICLRKSKEELVTIVEATDARELDFDFNAGMIYWYDFHNKKIYKTHFGAADKKVVIDEKLHVGGLAVDWIYGHIYWTDTELKTIEVANFEGTERSVLFKEMYISRQIAVDPKVGWMFYTNDGVTGRNGYIGKIGMDGTNELGTSKPLTKDTAALTLDVVSQRVYYIDISEVSYIQSLNYDLKHPVLIFSKHLLLRNAYAITTFHNFIFWGDQEVQIIMKANISSGNALREVTGRLDGIPFGLQIYNGYKQPNSENYCQAENMRCSHLCLPSPSSHKSEKHFTCTCPKGFHLLPNRLLCTNDGTEPTQTDAYLFFGNFENILNISIDTFKTNYNIINILLRVKSLDFHMSKEMIFWADGANISKSEIFNSKGPITIIKGGKLGAYVVAIDWIYNNIYWASRLIGTIAVASFKDNLFKILADDGKDSKMGLALNPLEGWMFWTDAKTSAIWKGGMDGSQKNFIVRTSIVHPSDITINFEDKRIYWTDSSLKIISSCDYNGVDAREILKVKESPYSIATFKGWVYWTTGSNVPLVRANITNTSEIQAVSSWVGKTYGLGGLKVYHSSKQPVGINYCNVTKMECSHLCLPGPTKPSDDHQQVSCACPENFRLLPDGFTCEEDIYSERCDRRYVVEVRIYNNRSNLTPYIQCSGTIITERWIITAATCVNGASDIRSIKILGMPGSKKVWDIMRMVIFPNFQETTDGIINDLALLKIAQRAPEEVMILPIKSDKWTTPDGIAKYDKIAVSRNYCVNPKILPNTLFSICGIKSAVGSPHSQLCKGGPLLENGIQIGILSRVLDIDKYDFTVFNAELYKYFIYNHTGVKHRRIVYSRSKFNSRVHSLRVRNK